MSKPNFTPGEWMTRTSERQPQVYGEDGRTIAIVYDHVDEDQKRANARLIAAAPALYAALGNLEKMVTDDDYTTIELDEARAALALVDEQEVQS